MKGGVLEQLALAKPSTLLAPVLEQPVPLVVLEDDVVLAKDWKLQLNQLLNADAGIVLLGWNLDSMLRAKFSHEQEIISLFEPAYPSENDIHAIVNSDDIRQIKRLIHAFGLPGYWLDQPQQRYFSQKLSIGILTVAIGTWIPEISTLGIDVTKLSL